MLTPREIESVFQSVLFKDMPHHVAMSLIKNAIKRPFLKGETLFLHGEAAECMCVVLSGWVKLVRTTPAGEDVVITVYTAGESFAEAVAFKGHEYPVSAEAAKDSMVLQLRAADVIRAIRTNPDLAVALLGCAFEHLHELILEIESMKALNGAQRLATFIAALAPVSSGPCTLALPYDKILLAGRLGMKPESLSRSLANLRAHGVIVKGGHIAINDVDALQSFIESDKINDWPMFKH